jgi:hypothetical protein
MVAAAVVLEGAEEEAAAAIREGSRGSGGSDSWREKRRWRRQGSIICGGSRGGRDPSSVEGADAAAVIHWDRGGAGSDPRGGEAVVSDFIPLTGNNLAL